MTIDEAIEMFVEMKNDGVEKVFVHFMSDKTIRERIAEIDEDNGWGATSQDVIEKVEQAYMDELANASENWECESMEEIIAEERENASLSTEAAE